MIKIFPGEKKKKEKKTNQEFGAIIRMHFLKNNKRVFNLKYV